MALFLRYKPPMQTQNPFLDEMSKLTQAAMGLAQAAGEEAKTALRAQSDRWAAELDLIRREEFEALKSEVAQLRARLSVLEAAAQSVDRDPAERA
jgi:BMFP domain-containing protein YqiC